MLCKEEQLSCGGAGVVGAATSRAPGGGLPMSHALLWSGAGWR